MRAILSRALAFLPAVLLGSVLPLMGCATPGDGMHEKLYEATRGYQRSIRWGDFDRAVDYLPAEAADAFLEDHEDLGEELKFVDAQTTRLKMDRARGVAAVRLQLQWHEDRSLVVETTTVDQTWQWFEGHWILVDERRSSGEPLDIFAEGKPGEEAHPYLPGLEEFRRQHEIGEENKKKKKSAGPKKPDPKKDEAARETAAADSARMTAPTGP